MSSAPLDLAGPWTFDDLADLPGDRLEAGRGVLPGPWDVLVDVVAPA